MREPVKGRTDAGRRREDQAHRTRGRIVDAGRRLFLERGYVATTVEAIAVEAGVAPATVYQAFGTKVAVLARVLDVDIAGDAAEVPLLERDWVRHAAKETDGRRRLKQVVAGAAAVAARTAPIKEVLRDAAASDPAAAALMQQDTARRRATQQALVDLLIEARPLRAGLSRSGACATFFAVVNSDTHRLLVGHLGWSARRWTTWLADLLERELFGSEVSVR